MRKYGVVGAGMPMIEERISRALNEGAGYAVTFLYRGVQPYEDLWQEAVHLFPDEDTACSAARSFADDGMRCVRVAKR